MLVEHGKSSIPTASELLASVNADQRVAVAPLDHVVLNKTFTLTTIPEMHDRQIVATALMLADQGETIAALTKDSNIRLSGLVPIVW